MTDLRVQVDDEKPQTGDWHYRAAERVLARNEERIASLGGRLTAADAAGVEASVAIAQVHATLALAAATMDAAFVFTPTGGISRVDGEGRSGWGYGR